MTGELRRVDIGGGLEAVSMNRITVDGIYGSNSRDYGFQIYTVKDDVPEVEFHYVDKDGTLDDDDVYWEGPWQPILRKYGEIDEEAWIKEGLIMGVNQERW